MYTDYSGEPLAYLVSLDFVNCDEMATGKDYERFEAQGDNIKTVFFGKDDVYVYDSMGRLYYTRGFEYEGEVHYGEIDDGSSVIKITGITQEHLPGTEGSSDQVKIIITIDSDEDIKKVTISDGNSSWEATEIEDGKYEVIVDENGNYEIKAEDVSGNKDSENITVTIIGSTTKPTVTATVTNGTYDESTGVYTVNQETVNVDVESATAKYIHIDNVSASPSSWLPYVDEFEKTYTTGGEKTIYIWVKDKFDNLCETPCELKVNIVLDGVTKPTPPVEDISGEASIEFALTPGNDVWAKSKELHIDFGEGKQSDGYTSMYRVKGSTGTWGRWTISYTPDAYITINRNNTEVQAKIVYSSVYTNETEIAYGEITVINIDTTPPKITSLEATANQVIGSGEDGQSGLHAEAFLITTEELNFKYVTDVDGSFAWQATPVLEIVNSAKYYFYVRDAVNNVAYASINANAKDLIPPEIVSIGSTAIEDYAVIRVFAKDNVGIVKYGMTKDNSSMPPETWNEVAEQAEISFEYNGIKEEGVYTIWVSDKEGNVTSASITVRLNKFPELDATLPEDLYIREGETGKFEVKIAVAGYPDAYEYQWEVSKDSGITWSIITGATSAIYQFKADYADNNNLYRCQVTNARGTISSREAKLEVVRITDTAPSAEIIPENELVPGGIIINNGATMTASTTLSLEVVALNAAEMSISETEDKGTWQTFADTTTYTLQDTTNGVKTINIWLRDAAGNEYSGKMTAEIELSK